MSKASDAANAMMSAVEKVCALYGVFVLREQSRTMMVEGTAGRFRPMFIGAWVDHFGRKQTSGKSDLIARPRVKMSRLLFKPGENIDCTNAFEARAALEVIGEKRIPVPLWIECKTGKGRMSSEQIAFKNYVETNGEFFLLLHDDVRPLIEWFELYGVEKEPLPSMQYVVEKIPAASFHDMPCRYCGKIIIEHRGEIKACPPGSPIIGKVWSPKLAKKAKA